MTKRVSHEELDTLIEGFRFEKRIDKFDTRYEIVTIRRPTAAMTGGPEFMPEEYEGLAALNRANGFFLTSASGALIGRGQDDLGVEVFNTGVDLDLIEVPTEEEVERMEDNRNFYKGEDKN